MKKRLEVKEDRNSGIDLLKIIAMCYVVMLHALYHGGVLEIATENSAHGMAIWFVEIWALCAVDVFALTSGYLSWSSDYKRVGFSSLLRLWTQVVFYGIVAVVLILVVKPGFIQKSDCIKVLFPITNGMYWYFVAYIGMVMLSPILRVALQKLPENMLRRMSVVLFVVFSVFDSVVERFSLVNGYSVIWLCILFFLGGAINRCSIGRAITPSKALIGIIGLAVGTWALKIWMPTVYFFDIPISGDTFVDYTSPTILSIAILYLVGVTKIHFSKKWSRILRFGAMGSFAIYLINDQRYLRDLWLKGSFVGVIQDSIGVMILKIVGFALAFSVGAILIDEVRRWLFVKLHINKLADAIGERLELGE